MRKIINSQYGRIICDTEKADLILRYIPRGIISRITKYPMCEIYQGREHYLYFKVLIYKKRTKFKPVDKYEVEDLVEKFFHKDSAVYKKHGPCTWEA